MKTIELSQNGTKHKGKYFAIVDDQDFELVSKYKWFVTFTGSKVYANTHGGNRVSMHRLIMGNPIGMDIDHKDGDGLNNTRNNLRIVTTSQNLMNRVSNKNSTSKYIGVYLNTYRYKSKKSGLVEYKKWEATISINGRKIFLGRFDEETEAAKCRDMHAKKYFGDMAKLNFI